ncbi:hypothetical protein ACHQM5_028178 [Ranunculus cassubicifolius]
MATTTYLQSLHHTLFKHQNTSLDIPFSSSLFLKPTTTTTSLSQKLTISTHFAVFAATSTTTGTSTTTPTSPTSTFDVLEQYLIAQDFQKADEETRRLIIVLAGEAAEKRGYVFFSEVQFIPEADLLTIDSLWRQYSNGRFGYSVQKKIYEKEREDFSNFFRKVGWMIKLETEEVDQYNYRAFPNEFTWVLNDDTPEGHLPLTNALRGTQLLKQLLNHPAFESEPEDEQVSNGDNGEVKKSGKSLSGIFKTDYSF